MFEKVNPCHPDKVADRIAGAIVDIAYKLQDDPKVAVEVLIGHEHATVIVESSVEISPKDVRLAVHRISDIDDVKYIFVPQDKHLAANQQVELRCGDNGIFKGVPTSQEESDLTAFVKEVYEDYPYDGKYILTKEKLICCQSHIETENMKMWYANRWSYLHNVEAIVNPLGDWTGGLDVDSGATNRKLGSDMGRGVTGGGLHGKDLSKADVSINIYAFLKAQKSHKTVELSCAIGDKIVDGKPYSEIVKIARDYIDHLGGFEKFAEWGLIR